MRVDKACGLSELQTKEIQELELACKANDGLKNSACLSNDINFNKDIPCFYMGYEENRLVSFLTAFIPSANEAEILAYTHPKARKRGCFRTLFEAAKSVLLQYGIESVLFAAEPQSKAALQALQSFSPIRLERSEYTMSCSGRSHVPQHSDLEYKPLAEDTAGIYVKLRNDVFEDGERYSQLVSAILASHSRAGYIAYYKDTPVGIFNLAVENGNAYCHGLGICKAYRGMGFGKQMMGYALEEGLKKAEKLVLDVDSNNPSAYQLYRKCGFEIEFQVDYYAYKL